MNVGLLGKKVGMTQIFTEDAETVGVTVIEAGPCYILQIKTEEKEGYSAIQCGFEKQKAKRLNKPRLGKFEKIKIEPLKFVREMRIKQDEQDKYKIGSEIKVDIFEPGDYVDIMGHSIGKGFQGVMKRWNFKGHPASHGAVGHRTPGSIGASATPSRVIKGKHMAGRVGNKRVTRRNIEVLKVDLENNLLIVKGCIPGPKGNYLVINKSKRKRTKKIREQKEESQKKDGTQKK